jgi:OmpA-OmpF porin, OOP family
VTFRTILLTSQETIVMNRITKRSRLGVFGLISGLCLSVTLLGGCKASASASLGNEAPPPPPPPADDDGDGITGDADKCPDAKEDGLPPDAKDGCPSPDPDGDGIMGDADKCADKPETKNGYQDADGCPDTPPPAWLNEEKNMVIHDEILFQTGSSTIDPGSNKIVEEIAGVLKAHPEAQFIEVSGHTDTNGSEQSNVTLARARSSAVMKDLVKNGVDAKRLRAVGYGPYCPEDKGTTEEAFKKNRRVDILIVRKGGKDLTPAWSGCAEAEAKGMKPTPIPASAPK